MSGQQAFDRYLNATGTDAVNTLDIALRDPGDRSQYEIIVSDNSGLLGATEKEIADRAGELELAKESLDRIDEFNLKVRDLFGDNSVGAREFQATRQHLEWYVAEHTQEPKAVDNVVAAALEEFKKACDLGSAEA
jgi:hypothetical protein